MDPISLLVTVVALYGLIKRTPKLLGELGEEWQAAKRGEESPAAAARRQRLIAAGIDPATGGPMRQYVGNRWRDHWLDADAKATKNRAERLAKEAAGEELSWRERLAERLDDEVTRRAEQWRKRTDEDTVPPVNPAAPDGDGEPMKPNDGQPGEPPNFADPVDEPSSTVHDDDTRAPGGHTTATPPGPEPDRDPIRVDTAVGDPIRPQHPPMDDGYLKTFDSRFQLMSDLYGHGPECEQCKQHIRLEDGRYVCWCTSTSPNPAPGASPQAPVADQTPLRVPATVGAPARNNTEPAAPAAITAGGTMSAVAQQAVTGVVSGAAEARAIQAALNRATEDYVAQLNRLRARIYSLGEQTLGTVQMSGKSHVVGNTAAAAEAAAAATANARACTNEVEPLLGNVARAFDRINS